jgi:hypothetical protein
MPVEKDRGGTPGDQKRGEEKPEATWHRVVLAGLGRDQLNGWSCEIHLMADLLSATVSPLSEQRASPRNP